MVDSSVLIDLERGGYQPEALTKAYPDGEFAVAAITVSELLFGVHQADSQERRQRRENFVQMVVQALQFLPFGLTAARLHSIIWFQLQRAGQMIKAHDLLIAAAALDQRAAVLTRDVRDFPKVPNLDVQVFDLSLLTNL